jgi:hypothetical protein
LESAGTLWSGNIPSANTAATAELTGLVTVIWLSTKYSVFLADSEAAGRIVLWENVAFEPFQATSMARLDEALLEEWEKKAGEFWFRESVWCQRFWPWLMTQDQTSWNLLTSKTEWWPRSPDLLEIRQTVREPFDIVCGRELTSYDFAKIPACSAALQRRSNCDPLRGYDETRRAGVRHGRLRRDRDPPRSGPVQGGGARGSEVRCSGCTGRCVTQPQRDGNDASTLGRQWACRQRGLADRRFR